MPIPPSSRPPRRGVARGVALGVLAAAATAGTLLGFGVRAGTPARPFNAVARIVLGDRATGIWGFDPVVTLTGLALHLAVMVGWGVLFSVVAERARGVRLYGLALLFTVGAFAVDVLVATRLLGGGVSGELAPGQIVGLHLVLGVVLAIGMRFAHSYLRSD